MTFNPNVVEGGFPYKCTVRYNWADDTFSETFSTKEKMFEAYRKSVIYLCGRLYGKYPRNRAKPLQTINHCE
jgi:hypothetical protein